MKPEGWLFRDRGAATLERVVPISERREADGDFTLALSAMEFYGGGGCVIRYGLDLYRPDLASLAMVGPETGQSIQFSSVEAEFAVRDQTGKIYDSTFDLGSISTHIENVEFRYGYLSIEPLRPETEELTVEIVRLIRHTRYNDASPARPMASEAEEYIEEIWTGPLSFTFEV